jgi:LacI family transcriptional regulator
MVTCAARAGVADLLRAGHLSVGFIADAPLIFTAAERLRGYREALAKGGLPFNPDLVHMELPTEEGVAGAIDRMLKHSPPATAFFTGNNRITIMFQRAIRNRRDRPALVAFDDFELADMLRPGITVVAQDADSMGRVAAELLFCRLDGDAGRPSGSTCGRH